MVAVNAIINVLMVIGVAGGIAYWIDRGGSGSKTRRVIAVVTFVLLSGVALSVVFAPERLERLLGLPEMLLTEVVEKSETTARGVVVSIVASAAIFIAANKLFDLAPDRWSLFTTLVGAAGAFVVYALLWGNRAIDDPVLRTVIATLVGALAGYLLGTVHHQWARLASGSAPEGLWARWRRPGCGRWA